MLKPFLTTGMIDLVTHLLKFYTKLSLKIIFQFPPFCLSHLMILVTIIKVINYPLTNLICRVIFHLIFVDVWGPSSIRCIDGFSYYVLFVHHVTKYSWFFPLLHKFENFSLFPKFKKIVEIFFKSSISTLYSYGGKERLNICVLKSWDSTSYLPPTHISTYHLYWTLSHTYCWNWTHFLLLSILALIPFVFVAYYGNYNLNS